MTLKGLGRVKVGEVFRILGYRDLIVLVGTELEGLGILRQRDHRGHKTRLDWIFNLKNMGLRIRNLTNHTFVLFTVEFPRVYHVRLQPVDTHTHTHIIHSEVCEASGVSGVCRVFEANVLAQSKKGEKMKKWEKVKTCCHFQQQ